jgi:hypothetical protein
LAMTPPAAPEPITQTSKFSSLLKSFLTGIPVSEARHGIPVTY